MSAKTAETCVKTYTMDESKAIYQMANTLIREATALLEDEGFMVVDKFERENDCWFLEAQRGAEDFLLEISSMGKVHAHGKIPKVAQLLALALAPLVGPYLVAVNEW